MADVDDITIRLAGDDDWPAVALLRWQWRVRENGQQAATTQPEFVRLFAEWARDNATTHRCVVVLRADRVIGMGWLAVTERVPTPRSLERRTGDVQSVYVDPDERAAGIGGRLIDTLVRLGDQLGLDRVTVHSSKRAISAYTRSGFVASPHLLQRT